MVNEKKHRKICERDEAVCSYDRARHDAEELGRGEEGGEEGGKEGCGQAQMDGARRNKWRWREVINVGE